MALLFIEGFEGIGTSVGSYVSSYTCISRKWTGSGTYKYDNYYKIAAGRISGYALCAGSSSFRIQTGAIGTSSSKKVTVGFGVKSGSDNSSYYFLALYLNDGTYYNVRLGSVTSGEFTVATSGGTVVATSSGASISSSVWKYAQVQWNVTTGAFTIKVAGATVLSATVSTSTSYFSYLKFGLISASTYLDDIYICDGTGSYNNDFLGDMKVVAVRPSTDATAGWTPNTGSSHCACVNTNPSDDDTTYLASSTSGAEELWGHAALSLTGQIAGMQINTDCRVTDSTSYGLKILVESGGTTSANSSTTISSTTYVQSQRILDVNPVTAAQWTSSDLDAAEFGIMVA